MIRQGGRQKGNVVRQASGDKRPRKPPRTTRRGASRPRRSANIDHQVADAAGPAEAADLRGQRDPCILVTMSTCCRASPHTCDYGWPAWVEQTKVEGSDLMAWATSTAGGSGCPPPALPAFCRSGALRASGPAGNGRGPRRKRRRRRYRRRRRRPAAARGAGRRCPAPPAHGLAAGRAHPTQHTRQHDAEGTVSGPKRYHRRIVTGGCPHGQLLTVKMTFARRMGK